MCENPQDVIKFVRVRDVEMPGRANPDDAGIDFYVPNDYEGDSIINPGKDVLIPSGIHMDVPKGKALIAFNKSGIATKLNLVAGACVVDSGYQGEIHLHLINVGKEPVFIRQGQKILQFILLDVNFNLPAQIYGGLEELYPEESDRGEGGFSSTDHK